MEKEKFHPEVELSELHKTMESLPEVQAGKDLWQNKFHEFDVYGHTVEFVKHLQAILKKEGKGLDPHLVAAGWLHDIGKPKVAKPKIKDGRSQEREPGKPYHDFDNHEIEGEKMVREMDKSLFERLGLNQEKVARLVGCHYLPMKGIKRMRRTRTREEFGKAFEDLEESLERYGQGGLGFKISKEEILLMFLADKLAQGDPEKYCTDREELFAIRKTLLSKNSEQRQAALREIYNLQRKRAEEGLRQYEQKE